MDISIEISLYPLAEDRFKDEIWAFIKRLRLNSALTVVTNGMSTQVFGEYDVALNTVMSEVKRVHEQTEAAVFVLKLINGDRRTPEAEPDDL